MDAPRLQHVNKINDSISIIPLNLQDHLILEDDRVVGMYHKMHKVARVRAASNATMDALIDAGFKLQTTSEPFILSEWTSEGEKACAEIIYNNTQ